MPDSSTPNSAGWRRRFLADAEPVGAGGNHPLALLPGSIWLVEAGQVEVFGLVRQGDAESRVHLATAGAGQLLLGAAPRGDLSLLAVGAQGTRLQRAPSGRLAAWADGEDDRGELAALLDGWLTGLFGEVSFGTAPKAFREARPGEPLELEGEGLAVRARQAVSWVEHRYGRSAFLGQNDALLDGAAFPLPEPAWLATVEPAVLAVTATADRLDEDLEPGLARFHERYLAALALHLARRQESERSRLERRSELDQSLLRGAYTRLASILTRQDAPEVALESTRDPLLAACRLVGERQGIAFVPPVESTNAVQQGDQLVGLCNASRVRYRRVILRGDWYRRDNGPLLAFRVLDENQKLRRPVALLPTSARGYERVDLVEARREPVDARVAEELSGEAYMFYPPLPERPLTPRDLLRAALRDRQGEVATVALMGLAGGLLGLLVPLLTGQLFGWVIPGAQRPQLVQITLALLASALASAAFQVTRSIAVLRFTGKWDGAVQAAVWDRLLALPVAFFRRYAVGDLANRSMGVDAIRELFTGNVLTSILASVFSVFSFALLFYYSVRLALVATGLVVVLLAVTSGLVWWQLRHQREVFHLQGKVSSLLFGLIGGLSKIRGGGAEQRAFALWAERFAEQRQRTYQAQRAANVQAAFNPLFSTLSLLVLFAMIGFSAADSRLSIGQFLAFNAAFGQFLTAALSMIGVFSSILTLVPIYERLSPILLEVPEVDPTKVEAAELSGEIEFSHVSFRYQADGPLILNDVSLRAEPGEFIALVGSSGAGKSTCLRLILGFEQPSSGAVYFDGQDLAALGLQSVRRQLGVVLQNGRPMVGDIFTNIVGNSNLGIDDAWEAARLAGLEDDIKAMPMGMHTLVSEGAETFSGGQRQRLLIARAIVHRPRIVLFDEATSALDNRTQAIVSQSLERLKATRIVIAHRLSTILNADRIYVFDAGRVVEVGTYTELLQRGGLFARLAARQIA